MAITSFTSFRSGLSTLVSVTSDLSDPTYYWYLDGTFVGTGGSERSFVLAAGSQAQVDVLDSTDPSFDPLASAPAAWAAYRTLAITRSLDPATASYLIEQSEGGDDPWHAIAVIPADFPVWQYSFVTPRLDDLTDYEWRATARDASGQGGTPVAVALEKIVRTPDAPGFSVAFDAGTTKVTFSA